MQTGMLTIESGYTDAITGTQAITLIRMACC